MDWNFLRRLLIGSGTARQPIQRQRQYPIWRLEINCRSRSDVKLDRAPASGKIVTYAGQNFVLARGSRTRHLPGGNNVARCEEGIRK